MYTPFAYAFAYAIKQTPYAFVAKIILCMYLLYGSVYNSLPAISNASLQVVDRKACKVSKILNHFLLVLCYCVS